jgi:tocopherol O-methyltransferase
MIVCPTVRRDDIRSHYDLATPFYRFLWGEHIHHGLWEGNESPAAAQRNLTETLLREAGVQPGERILDVGCGMGGSSLHLARHHECDVTGVTLSRLQRWWAARRARWNGLHDRARFLQGDAEEIVLPAGSFDVVWCIECSEHLFDKPRFFERAAAWLRPGGRLALCAWLAGDGVQDGARVRDVEDVCEGFLCPSLATSGEYRGWMEQSGLSLERFHDWTSRVDRTWEICRDRVRRSRVRGIARLTGRKLVLFLDRFETILRAYRTGAMKYGCFIARKPPDVLPEA